MGNMPIPYPKPDIRQIAISLVKMAGRICGNLHKIQIFNHTIMACNHERKAANIQTTI